MLIRCIPKNIQNIRFPPDLIEHAGLTRPGKLVDTDVAAAMGSPNKLSFVGLEVTAKEVAWVEIPDDEAVQLSNVRSPSAKDIRPRMR